MLILNPSSSGKHNKSQKHMKYMYMQTFFLFLNKFLVLWPLEETTVLRPSPWLDWKRLIEKLLVEVLLDIMHQDDRFALVIELRATCSPHHLQNICAYTGNKLPCYFRLSILQTQTSRTVQLERSWVNATRWSWKLQQLAVYIYYNGLKFNFLDY